MNRDKRIAAYLLSSIVLLGGLSVDSVNAQSIVTPSNLVTGGNQLVVPLFKSRVLRLDAPAARVSVGSPDIADILILRSTQLYVLGQDLGTTNVLVWDEEDRLIGAVNIEVQHDLDNLKAKLFELLPNEQIEVYSTQRSIVLAGQVSSPAAMNAALRIADTYLAQIGTAVEANQFQQQQGMSMREDRAVGEVINMMQVGGVQQVMLEIKVAEINRSELRRMNAQWNSIELNGQWNYGGVNGGATFPDVEFTTPVNGRLPVFGSSAPWGPAIDEFAPGDMGIQNQGLFASFLSDDTLFNMALDIAKENRLAKILAEPTLTTLTGEEATFLSGGEVAIPIPQGDFRTTFEFKEFGISVTFLPVVLGSGIINLKVDVTVSEITRLDPGSQIPLQLGTRRASSSVELREGQTMGLAGLLNENLREGVEKFPGLGSIPVLGALFRSQDFINQETELVITVTPHLARPMQPEDARYPTDNFVEPSDAGFYLLGKLEGRAPRSTGDE
ncbi:MAG: type II and III secretion system protein family protein [Gammaproteobacteria bacterium]|nr:type II and III secretion system protein family protein [Gammaproteobacteria bacterium]